tara:strand:+ start:35 stop:256 length:222 start_codon:yes stop_codon:yes gene_type:complete
MKKDNSILLEITNISWDQSKKDKEDLPGKLQLKWNDSKWTQDQILNCISEYYNVKVESLSIRELKSKAESGGG